MEYYNLVRKAVNLPPLSGDEEDFCQMATVRQSLDHIIPTGLMKAAEEACRSINYREQIVPLLSPEPGLLELLHWLRQEGVRLAVFTNRSEGVDELLRYFGLESFFSPVQHTGNSQPKPSADGLLQILGAWQLTAPQIAFLGDSKVDELAAKSAGVSFWAYRNPELHADLHVDDFFTMISRLTPLVEDRQ